MLDGLDYFAIERATLIDSTYFCNIFGDVINSRGLQRGFMEGQKSGGPLLDLDYLK